MLGGDDLEMVGIGVQAKALGGLTYHLVIALDQLKGPVTG